MKLLFEVIELTRDKGVVKVSKGVLAGGEQVRKQQKSVVDSSRQEDEGWHLMERGEGSLVWKIDGKTRDRKREKDKRQGKKVVGGEMLTD